MNNGERVIYEFGGFRLDTTLRTLLRNGDPVAVWPKVFDTLVLLLQSRGRIVGKEELMHALWPESFVEESNLTQNIFVLRRILGDDRNGHSFIQTVPRRGYKFVAAVQEAELSSLESDLPANYWRTHSPFRGLQVFETDDAWLFFGRESETEELLSHMEHAPVLSVVGNSGSGKSSLLRAGLIPALQQGSSCPNGSQNEQWRIAVFRPSVDPFDYLAEVLPSQLAPELSLQERAEFIHHFRNKLSAGESNLRDAIAALAGAMSDEAGPTRVLLMVDQFEELFTLTRDRRIRDAYIDSLLAAARLDCVVPVHLVLAVRADFYPECMEHAALSRTMAANQYNVGRMSHEQLRESIEKRLQLASAHAEAGLIDSLLEDVGSEPGNLALLEHALGQLWEKCGGFACTLTNKAYAEIGRLRGALGRHADEVYAGLRDEVQKQQAKRIFIQLVQLGDGAPDTRRRVAKADLLSLGKAEEIDFLLAHLASRRLISTGEEEQEGFVEVSHEALIREWPLLRDWLTQNRDDLGLERRLLQLAEEWQNLNRDKDALLQGIRLTQAEEWLGRHADVPVLLQDFVQRSICAREKARERELARQNAAAVRLRWFSAALALMLVLAVAAAWFTYREKVMEKSRAMAAQSGEMLQRDHGQALDLAIRSWEMAHTEEARLAVAKASSEPLSILQHEGSVTARFSPDGRRIATASFDRTARVWNAEDGRLLVTLQGHTDKVMDVMFSPDGRRIVTASSDHTARVWDSEDGRLLITLQGHADQVCGVEFSPDGQRIVTASSDHEARVWDSANGRLLTTLSGHTGIVTYAEFSPDGQRIVTTSFDHTARVWNSTDGRLLFTLHGHEDWVLNAAFSPDGQRIVTASYDHTARLWSAADGHLLVTVHHLGSVSYAKFSPDGQRIVTASYDRTAQVWNSVDGRWLFTLPHDGSVEYAEFSPDGQHIITASDDSTSRVWNGANGRLLAVLQGHSGQVYQASFSPSGVRIVTSSADRTARVWTNLAGLSLIILRGNTGHVVGAEFAPDGQRIVTASDDHTARVWNVVDGRLLATLQGHKDVVWGAQFSPDGQRIVTASWDHTARVWNAADGRLLATLQGHTDRVWTAIFSPDGQRIVTASHDHTARVWNAADGRLLLTLQGHTDLILSAVFSPDGQRVLTASWDHTARVWNAVDGRLLLILQGHTDHVRNASFSSDGQRIVTASDDHTARIWNSADGHLLQVLQGHSDQVLQAVFSPDGQRVVTASVDHTARVWNAADGRSLATLKGHLDQVRQAMFSPDGQRIVTASYDSTARVWNVADGSLLATLQGHAGWVPHAEFSPDGQRIVTASWDQTARIWQVLTLDDIERILAH